MLDCDSFETSPVPVRIPETRIRSARSAENLDCSTAANGSSGMTSEHRTGSFSTVPNYDNDDEAWATDDIGQLQVEVCERIAVLPAVNPVYSVSCPSTVTSMCVADGGSDQQQRQHQSVFSRQHHESGEQRAGVHRRRRHQVNSGSPSTGGNVGTPVLFQGSSNEILRRVTRGKLRVTQASVGSAQHDASVHVGASWLALHVYNSAFPGCWRPRSHRCCSFLLSAPPPFRPWRAAQTPPPLNPVHHPSLEAEPQTTPLHTTIMCL